MGEGTEKKRDRGGERRSGRRRGWLRQGRREGREGFEEAARAEREAARRRKTGEHVVLCFPLFSHSSVQFRNGTQRNWALLITIQCCNCKTI